MYRYAFRPRWILSHLFVLVSIVAFVNLGLWQLRRHDERAARNVLVVERSQLDPVVLDELLDDTGPDPEELRFRPVLVRGEWGAEDLLVDNRSLNGLPGVWVLRPLYSDDGRVVVVNRGFLSTSGGEASPPTPATGSVVVEGKAVPWAGPCGVRRDDSGAITGMACLDRDAAETVFGGAVADVVVERVVSAPPSSPLLSPVPLPELGSGPHRSYAGQWFIFATIVAVVYVMILRKVARERAVGDEISAEG